MNILEGMSVYLSALAQARDLAAQATDKLNGMRALLGARWAPSQKPGEGSLPKLRDVKTPTSRCLALICRNAECPLRITVGSTLRSESAILA